MKETFNILLQQCNKRDLKYKLQAIDCLTQIAEEWQEDFLQTLSPILDQLSSHIEDDDDDEDDEDMKENETKRNICVITSLGRLCLNKNLAQGKFICTLLLLYWYYIGSFIESICFEWFPQSVMVS